MTDSAKPNNSTVDERIENTLAGLMFFGWAVMRFTGCEAIDRWTVPQLVPAVIHVVVGILFLTRHSSLLRADTLTLAYCLPSFIAGGLAMKLAPVSHLWSMPAQAVFVIGGLGTTLGLVWLGKSFAVFPALRTIVTSGPFKLIRHPIYFSELLMIVGCCLAMTSTWRWPILAFAIATIVLRIVWEERVLSNSQQYLDFCKSVRWRLIPGIW